MQPVRKIEGTAVPLDRSDVDTDQIIPSDWLKRVERTGFGAGLFSQWREDPAFILNQPEYSGAEILIAGTNFGTGSSREHAVWALTDYGFKAVISSRFADIFFNNCTKAGLVPACIDADAAATLMAAALADPTLAVTVDVTERTVSASTVGLSVPFTLDDFTQHRLLEGLDDIGLSLRHESEIADYEGRRLSWLPSTA